MGTDKGCTLVLELSEIDPLFEKKKILLKNKGFSPKECVHISNLSSTTLDTILQVARILQLDEAEIYFGGGLDSQVDFYSPRNELGSLNSILSLLDISLASDDTEKNSLQDLREAVLCKIFGLGKEYEEEARFVKTSICEKENYLLQWGERNGVKSKLKIAYVAGAGRGALAGEDLKVGDVALDVPVSVIISENLVHGSDMFNILGEIGGISSETVLLLWSMKERYNPSSKFRSYFDALPDEFNTGLSFGVGAIMALDGTLLLEEIIQAKEHLRAQYDKLFPSLSEDYPDVFPQDLYTWERFLWACELWYSNGMRVVFADGKPQTCLIPIAGFLNHSLSPHIMHYGKVDPVTNSLKFPLARPCSVGEQCFLSYGKFSCSHLVTFYGFLPQGDNFYDILPLDIDDGQPQGLEDPVHSWNSHMVRGTWLSQNHDIFHYGLPSPLLDCLRRAQSPELSTDPLSNTNLEVELQVIDVLLSTFGDMMENLGESNSDERECVGWDVKLAVGFKDLQRRIVSSVLTSCYAGRSLVEKELHRCRERGD